MSSTHNIDDPSSSLRTSIGAGPLRRPSAHHTWATRWNNMRYCLFGAVICWLIMVPLSNYLQGHYRIVRIDPSVPFRYRDRHDNNDNNNDDHLVTDVNNDDITAARIRRGRTRTVRSAPSVAASTSSSASSSSSVTSHASRIDPLPLRSRPVIDDSDVITNNNDNGMPASVPPGVAIAAPADGAMIETTPVAPSSSPVTVAPTTLVTAPPPPSPAAAAAAAAPQSPSSRRRRGNGPGFHSSLGRPATTINDAVRLAERQREDLALELQLRATRPAMIDRGQRPQVCYLEPLTQQCAPFFFIIGVFKAGTTSVYNYLARHPEVLCKFDTSEDESGARTGNGDTAGGDDPRVVRTKETNFFAIYNRTNERRASGPAITGANGIAIAGGGAGSKARSGAVAAAAAVAGGQVAVSNPHSPKTIPDYMRIYFPKLYPSDGLMTGEASPSYIYTPHVPDKLHRTFPHARLILLVREPVQRAYSRVAHAISLRCARSKDGTPPSYCADGAAADVFDTVIRAELGGMDQCLRTHGFDHSPERPITLHRIDSTKWPMAVDCWTNVSYHAAKNEARRLNPLVKQHAPKSPELLDHVGRVLITRHGIQLKVMSHGLYILQLLYWRRLFPASQILVLRAEDLFKDTVSTMQRVEQHLHLAPFNWSTIVAHKYNVGVTQGHKRADFVKERGGEAATKKSKIHTDTRHTLERFFHPYNQLLRDYLGWDRDPWPYAND